MQDGTEGHLQLKRGRQDDTYSAVAGGEIQTLVYSVNGKRTALIVLIPFLRALKALYNVCLTFTCSVFTLSFTNNECILQNNNCIQTHWVNAIQGTILSPAAIRGYARLRKDTSMGSGKVGLKPTTLQMLNWLLYHLTQHPSTPGIHLHTYLLTVINSSYLSHYLLFSCLLEQALSDCCLREHVQKKVS